MNDNTVARLEKATGLPWRKVSVTYLEFASQGSPFKEYCAATPDDPDDLNPSYYIPDDHQVTYSPNLFVQTLIGIKEIDVDNSVVFEVSLDNLPAICFAIKVIRPSCTVVGKLQLTGKVRLQKIGTNEGLGISNGNFEAVMAREKIADIVANLEVNVNERFEISVQSEITKQIGDISIGVTPPSGFKIGVDPEANQLAPIYDTEWEITGNAGYEIQGNIYPGDNDISDQANSEYSYSHSLSPQEKAAILIGSICLLQILKIVVK